MDSYLNIVVTGGSHGLGRAIIDKFSGLNCRLYNLDLHKPELENVDEVFIECNVGDAASVNIAMSMIPHIDVLINNAGVNHIEWLEHESPENWDDVLNTNAKSIFLTAKAAMYKLTDSKGTMLNIVSNASHMPMTTSLAYNASKGAAHIMTLQLARELTKKNGITVFGISPAKIEGTVMSNYIDNKVPVMRGWTKEQAQDYQINGLVAGKEIPASQLADFIYYLLHKRENNFHLSGCIIPYGA